MEVVWIFLIVILLTIESLTFNLVTIWFAFGALGAFITAYFTDTVLIQWLVFTIVSLISLIGTRPIIKKFLSVKPVKTNLDLAIGMTGIVTSDINKDAVGRVSVLGKDWAAISDEVLETNSKVEILSIEGVKLVVKRKDEE